MRNLHSLEYSEEVFCCHVVHYQCFGGHEPGPTNILYYSARSNWTKYQENEVSIFYPATLWLTVIYSTLYEYQKNLNYLQKPNFKQLLWHSGAYKQYLLWFLRNIDISLLIGILESKEIKKTIFSLTNKSLPEIKKIPIDRNIAKVFPFFHRIKNEKEKNQRWSSLCEISQSFLTWNKGDTLKETLPYN